MVLGNRVWSVLKFELFEKYGPVTGNEPINQRTRRIISNNSNFRKQNPRKNIKKFLVNKIPEKFLSYCHLIAAWQSVPIYHGGKPMLLATHDMIGYYKPHSSANI